MKYKNNPLNIRYTSKSKWLGLIGSKNGFCEFSSIEFGIRAGLYLILKTYKNRGWLTIRDIIMHWAPASDGNSPHVYIFNITTPFKISQLDFFFHLSRNQQFNVVHQMCVIESGFLLSRDVFDKAYSLL